MTRYEKLLRKLKAECNVEEDELKVLGLNTEEGALEVLRAQGIDASDETDDAKTEPVDNTKLSTAQRRYVSGAEKEATAKAKIAFTNSLADQSHLPPAERVTADEVAAAGSDLYRLAGRAKKAIKPRL